MSTDHATDRRYLTEKQYADSGNLAARQSIYAFQQPKLDIGTAAFELAGVRGNETMLDIGCGNGLYFHLLRARGHRGLTCGADLSPGMLRSARRAAGSAPLLVSDAQALPFADDSFDVTLAMHMLYHVPDRALAVAELRRVLRPGGVALVVTNSTTHLQELDGLLIECAASAVGADWDPGRSHVHFTMENGAADLEASFRSVTPHLFPSELVITEVEPVVNYARSMGAWVADTDHQLDAVLPELARRVEETIATQGAFRVRTAAGCFICRG